MSDSLPPHGPLAHQAPLSLGFSRQEYGGALPCRIPGGLPDPGMEPMSPAAPALQADSIPLSHWGSPSLPGQFEALLFTPEASHPLEAKPTCPASTLAGSRARITCLLRPVSGLSALGLDSTAWGKTTTKGECVGSPRVAGGWRCCQVS